MTSEWQVFGWLNRNSTSHLTADVEQDIRRIRAAHLPESEKILILNSLMSLAHSLPDSLEKAELSATCGILCYSRGLVLDANRCLRDAQKIYSLLLDRHRQAILEWLLFLVFHGQGGYQTASYWSNQTFNNLWKQVKLWNQQRDPRREKWYQERVFEITSRLIVIPLYVYEYLFKFHGSRLSSSALIVRGQIHELIMDRNQNEMIRKMDLLQKITQNGQDSTETAEAYALCGTLQYQMGNIEEAIHLYRLALARYIPNSHEHTFVRWMLALSQLELPARRSQAVIQLEECIGCIHQLAEKADHQNEQTQHIWYDITAEGMRRAMKRVVARLP